MFGSDHHLGRHARCDTPPVDLSLLATIPATSDASRRLAELIERRREAAAAVSATEAAQRQAYQDHREASDAVADLERHAALGDEPPPEPRKRAETALRKAQATRDEPWAERIRGKRLGVQAVEQEIAAHVTANLSTLVAELEEDARLAAAAVDEAARALVDRYMEREAVGQRLTALVAATGRPMRPGATYESRAGEVAQAAQALLRQGERPPTLTFDVESGKSTRPVVAIGEPA
jgi:colicin import membrane protein